MEGLAHQYIGRHQATVKQHRKEEEEGKLAFPLESRAGQCVRCHRSQKQVDGGTTKRNNNGNLISVQNRLGIVQYVLKCSQVDLSEKERIPLCADRLLAGKCNKHYRQ